MKKNKTWYTKWEKFKRELPHKKAPFSKRNWGNQLHSLCSYQGKLKPSIASHLVDIFVPDNGKMLDPFAGVGTIPFEAALQGKKAFAFELSKLAYIITNAKLSSPFASETEEVIIDLKNYLGKNKPTLEDMTAIKTFGFNGKLSEYYHKKTLEEILLARKFFLRKEELNPSELVVLSCLLHILHGNRPYALSRNSHPLTPYAPTGEVTYKSLIDKLKNKVTRTLNIEIPQQFIEGTTIYQDSTECWSPAIPELDAIITSPPFFDSTRFYMNNWIRIWFTGWSEKEFKIKPTKFVDERQKQNFDIYENIIRQSREKLKEGGVLLFHLGKSKKCNMAEKILDIGLQWFSNYDLFTENVQHVEKHGIKDKGTVTDHSYLLFY